MSKKKRNFEHSENMNIINKEEDDFIPRNEEYLPETDNKRWELDENPVITNLRHELKFRVNSRGVEEITGWLRMAMGKNVALTNLDQKEINWIVKDNVRTFNKEAVNKRRLWQCRKENLETLSRWIETAIYAHLKRAYKDGERKYRKESYGYNENYSHDEVSPEEIGGGSRGLNFYNPFKGQNKRSDEDGSI